MGGYLLNLWLDGLGPSEPEKAAEEASVVALVLGALSVLPTGAVAFNSCRAPRGPGDNLVHSYNLRAKGVSWSLGPLAILVRQFEYLQP